MKFYSVSNPDYRSTSALSLTGVRTIEIVETTGSRCASRFGVRLEYRDDAIRSFNYLTEEKARKVYKEILEILNKGAWQKPLCLV